ncbi:MAG: hypothetical protein ACTHK2_09085 [Dokdonella sp.]|uniref:hypothetical protein n=1 Tax=Dokdonella sp. TaxID=2291710 RepID=UPI003F7EED26
MAISKAHSQLIAVAVTSLIVGYFIGREHIKYQLSSAFASAAGNFAAALSGATGTSATKTDVAAAKDNAADYASSLRIYDWTAKYFDTFTGRVPGISFKVKNEGDRTVTRLKIVVYFQDANGANVAEEEFTPILAGGIGLDNAGPLRPGYVWQQEPHRFLSAKRVPSEWKEGATTVAVREVEFE